MPDSPHLLTTSLPGRFEAELEGLDDATLEEQLCLLAGNINAASYRFVKLIAACDERRLWAQQGARSCAFWLNWVCGLSLHAAREKIRVGHALGGLPKISAAYSAGELSYSKVRAMTRIATPDNEDYLLMINSARGTMKISTADLAENAGLDEKVEGGGTAGQPYDTIEELAGA